MSRLVNMRPDSEVEPLLSAHLNHLRKLNHSGRSLRERRLTVLRLARWLKHPVADVTREELTAYQDSQSHLTPASMHNMVVHVSQYLGWLAESEHRADDPSRALVRPRNVHRSLPRPMADAAIERALAAAAQPLHPSGIPCLSREKKTCATLARSAAPGTSCSTIDARVTPW